MLGLSDDQIRLIGGVGLFETIAVPLDGSELGELALTWATEIASSFGSRVYLLSVAGTSEDQNMRQAYLEHRAEVLREDIAERSRSGSALPLVEVVLIEGDPAGRVVEFTETTDVNLLLLVSHGKSGIMPWPMGSTASRILARESKPVLFVRARKLESAPASVFDRIVVALDGSVRGEEVIPYVEAWADHAKSNVVLFHSISASYEADTIGGITPITVPKVELDRKQGEASAYLDGLKKRFSVTPETIVCIGKPANEIIAYADENNVSLIAITSRGTTGASDWRFGEVAYKLLHGARQAVFIVKSSF